MGCFLFLFFRFGALLPCQRRDRGLMMHFFFALGGEGRREWVCRFGLFFSSSEVRSNKRRKSHVDRILFRVSRERVLEKGS